VQWKTLLQKAGLRESDLPVIPKYVKEGKNGLAMHTYWENAKDGCVANILMNMRHNQMYLMSSPQHYDSH
jgi:hypothetical protein